MIRMTSNLSNRLLKHQQLTLINKIVQLHRPLNVVLFTQKMQLNHLYID